MKKIKGNGAIKGASKKRNKKNIKFFNIFKFIIIIFVIIVVLNILKNLFNKKNENVSFVLGDQKINIIHNIIVDKDDNIFISIDDIKNIFDSNIFYSNNILITTYNKHIAVLEKGKNTMKVNDVVQEIKGYLKEENGIIYVPFSDMQDVYDFEKKYNNTTKVLSVDSKSKEKKEAIVIKTSKIYENTKLFSKKIEKIKKAEYVTVFEENGKYTKIRTNSGNIGYIKTNKLSESEVKWENMDEEKIEKLNILNDYSIVDSKYEILENLGNDNIVIPNLFEIVQQEDEKIEINQIIDLEGNKYITYKDWANQSNITICPSLTLNCNMSKVCNSYETRSYVINTLYNILINYRLTMICIDFSNIDDVEGVYRFVTEMVPRFKCAGMKVLVKFNNYLNKERLDKIVDYVIYE